MWTDIRCNMTEIYCTYQKMSTISVIMETMFVIAMRTQQLRFAIQTYSDKTESEGTEQVGLIGMANAHANDRICRNHACPIV